MLACEICSRTSDRDREIENLREDREAILTIDARESKEECCDALEVLARHHGLRHDETSDFARGAISPMPTCVTQHSCGTWRGDKTQHNKQQSE